MSESTTTGTPDLRIALSILKRDLLGDYEEAARYCGVSHNKVVKQLNAYFIDTDLIAQLTKFRDKKRAERLRKESELIKKIKATA